MQIFAVIVAALVAFQTPPTHTPAEPVKLAGVAIQPTRVPGAWEGNGLPENFDGVAWYVGEVTLTAEDCGAPMELKPGTFDDDDEAWFNGKQVGASKGSNTPRLYQIPKELLQVGVNRIAFRVSDIGGAGGWVGAGGARPVLESEGSLFDLSGSWWITAGDHPEIARVHPVMDPQLHARLVPIPIGTRRTKVQPMMNTTGTLPDLWYPSPANAWTSALPLGNGRLGAMVFGGVDEEHLQLNEASVWEGNAQDRNAPEAVASFRAARELALAGKIKEAQEILQRDCMLPSDMMPRSHQTLGDLFISFLDIPARATDYRRSLQLNTGTATTRFALGKSTIIREVICSAPDELLLVHTRIEGDGTLPATRIKLTRSAFESDIPVHTAIPTQTGVRLAFTGHTGQGGVAYCTVSDITTSGGTITIESSDAVVRNARSFTVAIAARTSYFGGDPEAQTHADLRSAAAGFAPLAERAAAWYLKFMSRVELDLGGPPVESSVIPDLLSTDARLERFRIRPQDDNDFLSLYFQYGRYLLLSSSRDGSLPANLQGIWNKDFRAPWNADFHTNINVQMNYWPAGPCALAETELPLIDLIDKLRARGTRTAKDLYGARGWCCHHITDAWAMTSPEGQTVWGMYPLGGAWLVRHAWEHYLHTVDANFLRDRAYPAMEGVVQFLLDFLVIDPATGKLVSGPSTSPENTFILPDGTHANISMATSMDQWIARDALVNYLDAARILGRGGDPLPLQAAKALDALAMPAIGSDGRLMEWSKPFAEAEPGHRHMSHLYGLHPANFITPDGRDGLAAAARASLEARLKNGGGHTGWSRAWLINLWARLHEGDRAWNDLTLLLAKSTLPNLFDDHPPFQIDGNFGATAGLSEMLMQSQSRQWSAGHLVNRIDLLPALPEAWPNGRVRGLVARGAVKVDIQWKNGRMARAQLDAPNGGELHIGMPKGITSARIACAGEAPIELPIPGGIVIIPRAASPAPRTVVIIP